MRYFITKTDDTFLMFESDDDLTKYRTISIENIKKIGLKLDVGGHIVRIEACNNAWIPIVDKEYFLVIRDEISPVDMFAHLL